MRKVQKDLLPHPKIALSTPFFISGRNNRGVALILTVGVLALILLVGTSFAINMIADLKSAKNFRNAAEAKYLAEAGINRAISELLYGTEGFVSDAVDSSDELWAQSPAYNTPVGNGGYRVDKIYDCAGQICINDANPNLSVILENLVASLGAPLSAGDGAAIVTNRPAAGYTTKETIIEALPGAALADKKAKYNKIKDHITLQAFIDYDVISPASPYPAAPRAPVNVNTASREVLIAVLTGISDGTNTMTSAKAAALTDHLINNRPYGTYDQLWGMLLSAETLGYIAAGDAAAVMANANPNTDLMRANPNYSWRYKHVSRYDPANPDIQAYYDANGVPLTVDKTALSVYTTEFCFNSGGYYEINATGFINDASGNQVASKSLQAVVKLFDIWKQTTQAQFAQGTISNTELYPEYDQASSGVSPAAYDGQVMLTTRKEAAPSGTPHFKIDYADKANHLNADSAGGNAARQTSGVTGPIPREAGILANPAGNLMPDGVFYPRDGQTIDWFYPENNIEASRGSIEIWFKPNFYERWVTFPTYDSGKIFETQTRSFWDADGNEWKWSNSSIDMYMARGSGETSCKVVVRVHGKDGLEHNFSYWLWGVSSSWGAGTWHHLAFVWDFNTAEQHMYIDGISQYDNSLAIQPYGFTGFQGLQFGCDTNANEPPNGTMDEIRVFPTMLNASDIGNDCAAGRYYDVGDASFTSSSHAAGAVRLGTISWTEHVSDMNGNPIIPGADITFDVFDGANWLGNSSSRSNPAGNPLNVVTGGTGDIRYNAYFLESGDGLLDSPVLDDVTITYQKRAKILYWRNI
ncbi:MAG: LamG-like jellyroll fold domain-containing protein [Candidatus Omnitrophota bacterium]|jgi:hypothetical protein